MCVTARIPAVCSYLCPDAEVSAPSEEGEAHWDEGHNALSWFLTFKQAPGAHYSGAVVKSSVSHFQGHLC